MIKKIFLFSSLIAVSGLIWTFTGGAKQHQEVQIKNAPNGQSTGSTTIVSKTPLQTTPGHQPEENPATESGNRPRLPQQPEQNRPLEELDLWVASEQPSEAHTDDIPVHSIKVNPNDLQQFTVGQTLLLEIPGQAPKMKSQLTKTYNDPGGIKVWQGQLTDEPKYTNVMITQGKIQTHITIASSRGNYSVVVNNQTGDGTIMDESQINERLAPIDDGIVFEGTSPLH